MSYTPTEWKKGDIVTSEKLNNMESGIEAASAGAVLYVTQAYDEEVDPEKTFLDKTWNEINDALTANKTVILKQDDTIDEHICFYFSPIHAIGYDPESDLPYYVEFFDYNTHQFAAATADGTIFEVIE